MADSIKDDGLYGKNAPLSGAYTLDTPNRKITYGVGGQADTGHVLPNEPHILVETYDINGVSGATSQHWYTKKAADLADINTYLAACQAAIEENVTASRYTAYKMKATYYKGSSKADTYDADENTAFPTIANDIDLDYTPLTTTWKVTGTLTAPVAAGDLYGPELLTNAEFPTDVTGWTMSSGGTLEHSASDNGCAKMTWITSDAYMDQEVSGIEIGAEYRQIVSVYALSVNAYTKSYNNDVGVFSAKVYAGSEPTDIITDFVATQTVTAFRAYIENVNGDYVEITKHSLKKKL